MDIKTAIQDTKRSFRDFIVSLTKETELSLPAKKNLVNISQGILTSQDTSLKSISSNILPNNHEYRNHKMVSKEVMTNEIRISQSLMKNDYSQLNKNILEYGKKIAPKEKVQFIIDASDLAKPTAKKMEKLSSVPDGSNNNKIVNGYKTTNIQMTTALGQPYMLFSEVNDPTIQTQREKEHMAIDELDTVFSDRIREYLADSSYSGAPMINHFLRNHDLFITRVSKNREFDICGSEEYDYTAEFLAEIQDKWHLHTITTFVFYDGKYGTAKISYIKGNVKDVDQELSIITINSDIGVPMVLITNEECNCLKDAMKIYFKYLSRWKIERTFKFIKEKYHFENFHVRTFQSIQNLYKLIMVMFNFLSLFIKKQSKKLIEFLIDCGLCISNKDVQLKHYRIADGIKNILTKMNKNFDEYIF